MQRGLLGMKFSDIIGNKEGIRALREMADSGRIPHAILLSGPAGIGKMRLARAFASYINCENRRDGDSCGVCPACRQIDAFNFPDIHYSYPIYKSKAKGKIVSTDYLPEWKQFLRESPYMDFTRWMELMNAENSQPKISVDESDEISVAAAVTAFNARYKIFIIWLPEKMGLEAANKLLKVLEEPFEDTIFICVSNDPGSILPTIYSRLQRIELLRPNNNEIESALIGEGVSPQSAATLSRLCEGSLLRAVQMARSEGETEEFGAIFRDVMRAAYARKVASLQIYANNIAAFGREKELRLLDYFARMTRENYISNLCIPPLNLMTHDEEAFSQRFAPFINNRNVETILQHIDDARRDISRNGNSKLIIFDFLLHLMIELRK